MLHTFTEQAVELALKVDPSLARELARQSDDRDETKRLVSHRLGVATHHL
jgi:hypothetical protein